MLQILFISVDLLKMRTMGDFARDDMKICKFHYTSPKYFEFNVEGHLVINNHSEVEVSHCIFTLNVINSFAKFNLFKEDFFFSKQHKKNINDCKKNIENFQEKILFIPILLIYEKNVMFKVNHTFAQLYFV